MALAEFQDQYPRIVERLFRTRRKNRIFHSWIFAGDTSSALNAFVYAWLQSCICPTPKDNGDACGMCDFCQRFTKCKYPYLFEIKPVSKSRQILVEQIRDLEHFLFLKTQGETKIGLILDADRMSVQAQNAFLKTLEEPVTNTILVLTTHNVEALLLTIRSRCQAVSLLANRYAYNFRRSEELFYVLASMGRGTGAAVAMSAADQINTILADLQKDANAIGNRESKNQVSPYLNDDKEAKKKFESIAQAQVASHYLSLRNQVISAIHGWFSQQFLRSSGIPINLLPNPEFYEALPEEIREQIPSSSEAQRSLHLAELLVEDFTLNIGQLSALQEFCYKICIKDRNS